MIMFGIGDFMEKELMSKLIKKQDELIEQKNIEIDALKKLNQTSKELINKQKTYIEQLQNPTFIPANPLYN